jgi:hypothetical protein
MNAETENGAVLDHADADQGAWPQPLPWRRWCIWLGVFVIGGYLLFAHGCHGDEDNELFAAAHGRGTSIGNGFAKKLVSYPLCAASLRLASARWF